MTLIQRQNQHFDFRTFMVNHQYKVMCASLVAGLIWVGIQHLLATSWFFSRLSLLLAVICFVPAWLVILAHFCGVGNFVWWDQSNVVWTTRRSPKLEKAEFAVMVVLWAMIFVFVVVVIFVLAR